MPSGVDVSYESGIRMRKNTQITPCARRARLSAAARTAARCGSVQTHQDQHPGRNNVPRACGGRRKSGAAGRRSARASRRPAGVHSGHEMPRRDTRLLCARCGRSMFRSASSSSRAWRRRAAQRCRQRRQRRRRRAVRGRAFRAGRCTAAAGGRSAAAWRTERRQQPLLTHRSTQQHTPRTAGGGGCALADVTRVRELARSKSPWTLFFPPQQR